MVIVDSTVWIDYLAGVDNPETRWLGAKGGREEIGLTELILCEVLQGLREERSFQYAMARLMLFPIPDAGGVDIAVASARNYRALRARGITVRKTIDCLIATFCIRAGHGLLHRDREFDPFEQHLGLRVIHP
jgi:predicted nucleic acid-binding protein